MSYVGEICEWWTSPIVLLIWPRFKHGFKWSLLIFEAGYLYLHISKMVSLVSFDIHKCNNDNFIRINHKFDVNFNLVNEVIDTRVTRIIAGKL